MALSSEMKKQIIAEHGNSSGTPEAQIAIFSADIKALSERLNQKDKHSLRGLRRKIHARRKQLLYLKKISLQRYLAIIKKLGLRGVKTSA